MGIQSANGDGALKKRPKLQIGRALRLVWGAAPGWTAASMVLLLIQGALPAAMLYLTKLVVDAVSIGAANPDKAQGFHHAMYYVGLVAIAALVAVLCRLLGWVIGETQAQVVTDHVFDLLHAKSYEVDLQYYENPQYHDILYRAQQEAPMRPTRIVNSLAGVIQNGISLLAIAGLLLSFHAGLTLMVLAATLPGIAVRLIYSRRMFHWQLHRTPEKRLASYFHWMLSVPEHAKEIRLFDLGALFTERYRSLQGQLRSERLALVGKRAFLEIITNGLATGAIYASVAFVAWKAVLGAITVGGLVMYYQAFQRGQGFVQEILVSLACLYEDSLFLTSLYEFLDIEPDIAEPSRPKAFPKPMKRGIEFRNVRFQYPGTSRMALEAIDLQIKPGQVVALVGENGSGKTTLIKLLCRLYDPTEGSITVDNTDLSDFETKMLRKEIGVIFQDYAKYKLSARENIWFGNRRLDPEDQRIVAAARRSGADGVITRLPRGYDTILGKWLEEGEELSIGEWQQVALARAFVRDSQVVVLDEPSSAMDAMVEYEVFEKIRQLAEGRAIVLISHRFSTVKMADAIYVLEGGRIIERGTHDELMRMCGKYARMFETQAQYYR